MSVLAHVSIWIWVAENTSPGVILNITCCFRVLFVTKLCRFLAELAAVGIFGRRGEMARRPVVAMTMGCRMPKIAPYLGSLRSLFS